MVKKELQNVSWGFFLTNLISLLLFLYCFVIITTGILETDKQLDVMEITVHLTPSLIVMAYMFINKLFDGLMKDIKDKVWTKSRLVYAVSYYSTLLNYINIGYELKGMSIVVLITPLIGTYIVKKILSIMK